MQLHVQVSSMHDRRFQSNRSTPCADVAVVEGVEYKCNAVSAIH